MAKSLIPKSKAKTAYGLLSEIAALIIAEPKRYNQGNWLHTNSGVNRTTWIDTSAFPVCGTIGCVAGWVTTLRAPAGRDTPYCTIPATAARILGLNDDQENELFDGRAAPGDQQTAQHARGGARHIRRFQKKYRAQLLAKRVR